MRKKSNKMRFLAFLLTVIMAATMVPYGSMPVLATQGSELAPVEGDSVTPEIEDVGDDHECDEGCTHEDEKEDDKDTSEEATDPDAADKADGDKDEVVSEDGEVSEDALDGEVKKPVIKDGILFHNEDGSLTLQVEAEADDKAYNIELYNVKEAKEGDLKGPLGLCFDENGKAYHILGIMTINQHDPEKYYKNDQGRWVMKDTLYYPTEDGAKQPSPGETTMFTIGTIGPDNPSEVIADPVSAVVPEKGKSTRLKIGPQCDHPVKNWKYEDNNDGYTHKVICTKCNTVIDDAPHVPSYDDNGKPTDICSYCKGKMAQTIDLSNTKIVGENEDPDHKYTKKEAEQIGLVKKDDGTALIKGKDYTETITEKTGDDGKPVWEIVYKPVEKRTKGEWITITKKKASEKTHNVTVHYVLPSAQDGVMGQAVAPTVVKSYEEGTTFSIASPIVAVPNAPGKFYTRNMPYVNGTMGETDLEYSVIYKYETLEAEATYVVDITYVVEAKEGDAPETPKRVKLYKKDLETYTVFSPKVPGYKPDIDIVAGKINHKDAAVTVTYKPAYKVTINIRKPGADESQKLVSAEYADGQEYRYDIKEALEGQASIDLAIEERDSWNIQAFSEYAGEEGQKRLAAITATPAEVSGTIQGKDVEVEVTLTCSHPEMQYLQISEEQHLVRCKLCHSGSTLEDHTYGDPIFMTPEEIAKKSYNNDLRQAKIEWPGGAMAKICTKCGYAEYTDPNEDYCPARPAEEKAKHLWSSWEKISDTQCTRTCARCKLTITTSHAWGDWAYCSSKSHYRMCALCHCTETADHGGWTRPTIKKEATCISNAEASAYCSICHTDVDDVYYGIVGTLPLVDSSGKTHDTLVKTGHQFDGGLVNIHGGHTQKCSLCGAFDMENLSEHAFGDWYVTKDEGCGGKIYSRRDCPCGAYEKKDEANEHNYVRDTAREVEATCEKPGTECYTCTKCGDHNDKTVDKLGHNWVEDEGNYPATCEQAGHMSWHCSNPGCMETKVEEKEPLSPNGQHKWVPYYKTRPTCKYGGCIEGVICEYCNARDKKNEVDYPGNLGHSFDVKKQTVRRRNFVISQYGKRNADVYEEVIYVTRHCTRCGYDAPNEMYTVARSNALSRYKIESGVVNIKDMSDGVHVDGQMGKDNAIYFNNQVDEAFKVRLQTVTDLYSQKEGSVETHFTQEFLDTLADGNYEMIHINGDELTLITITVKDHKITQAVNSIAALDESGLLKTQQDDEGNDDYGNVVEKIEVDGEERDYYPWISDGEMLYYLGVIGDNATSDVTVPQMEDMPQLGITADPKIEPANVSFNRKDGNPENQDVVVIKYDKGHEFNEEDPVHAFDTPLPATELIPAETEGDAPVNRTNYTIKNDKITFTKEYLSSLGEGRHEFIFNYIDGAQAMLTIEIAGSNVEIADDAQWSFEGDYFALNKGEKKIFTFTGLADEQRALVKWSVVDENGNPSEVVTVDATNAEVTAVQKGTAWVIASAGASTARCRIDVYDNEPEIGSVTLDQDKTTVELYSNDYTKVAVWFNMTQNNVLMDAESAVNYNNSTMANAVMNNGILFREVSFVDEAAAAVFDLHINDDNTISIMPKAEFVNGDAAKIKTLKGSYKTKLKLKAGGKEFESNVLTIALKKTLPKVKTNKVVFNSAVVSDVKALESVNGEITDIELTGAAQNWFKAEGNTLVYTGKQSAAVKGGKYTFKVTIKGWVKKIDATINVSAAVTKSKLKLSKTSVTLKPGSGDSAVVDLTIAPELYAGDIPTITILEGKEVVKDNRVTCTYENGKLTVACADGYNDSKARSYKAQILLHGTQAVLNIKTLEAAKKPALKVKATGEINSMIENSTVTLDITPVNYNKNGTMVYATRVTQTDKKTKTEKDITALVTVEQNGDKVMIREKAKGSLKEGFDYKAYVSGTTKSGLKADEISVKFVVKAKAKAANVTVKVKGYIDVIRPATSIAVTPVIKDFYDYTLSEENLAVYVTQNKKTVKAGTGANNPYFNVTWDGTDYTLTAKDGAKIDHVSMKFAVGLEFKNGVRSKKNTNITVKMGASKFSQSTKAVTMSSKDRYSEASVQIAGLTEGVNNIDHVVIVSPLDKSKKRCFNLKDMGGGKYNIIYNGYKIPNTKGGNVKLHVYLKGNNSNKPNATIIIKVTVK